MEYRSGGTTPLSVCCAFCAAISVSWRAGAQQCLSDADCADPRMTCQRDDPSPGAPCLVPDECPETQPEPGICVVDPARCTTDADCEEGFICDVVSQSSAPCAPSADGSGCGQPTVMEVRECVAEPLTCQTDADCASGLTCMEEEGGDCIITSGAPGTGSGQETSCETKVEKLCTWQPSKCSSDADCSVNEECVGLGQSCYSEACSAGQDCDDAVVCEPDASRLLCFPKQRPCVTSVDCAAGELCFDVSSVGDELPEWWDATLGSEYCFSEGMVLAIQGRAAIGDFGADATSGAVSRGTEHGSSSDETELDAAGNADTNSGADGGCAVARHRFGGGRATTALLLLGVFAAFRRRRPS